MSRSLGVGNVSQFMLGNRSTNMMPTAQFQPLTMPLATGVADLMNYSDPRFNNTNLPSTLSQNFTGNPIPLDDEEEEIYDELSFGTEDEDLRTIFCGYLEEHVDEELLYELFLQAGPIERVCIPKDRSGRTRCFAFIIYVHKCSPAYALKLFDGLVLNNKRVQLSMKTTRSTGNKRAAVTPLASQNAKRHRKETDDDCRVTVPDNFGGGQEYTLSEGAYNRLQSFVRPASWLPIPSLMSKIIAPVNQYLSSMNSNKDSGKSGRNGYNSPNYREKSSGSHSRRRRHHTKERRQRWDNSPPSHSGRKYRKF